MIVRVVGVVAAALMLVAAAVLWLHGRARATDPVPVAALAQAGGTASLRDVPASLPLPPQASEATREEKRFNRYDHDRNEAVSRDEYLAARHKAFARLDTNGDGKLSFDEWAAKAEAKFAAADADKSGTLTRAEFATTKVVRKTAIRRSDCPPQQPDQPGAED